MSEVVFTYRGSVTDLATDICYAVASIKVTELVHALVAKQREGQGHFERRKAEIEKEAIYRDRDTSPQVLPLRRRGRPSMASLRGREPVSPAVPAVRRGAECAGAALDARPEGTREDRTIPEASMNDTFYEGLCEEHVKMQGRMQAEINRLRREKAALQQTIDAMPSTLTELQDRVTMLEGLLRESLQPRTD